jgi:hypothetical protein
MEALKLQIGLIVVRSKGDYVVGRLGAIVEIVEGRARVEWEGAPKSMVKADVIEDAATPYGFTEFKYDRRTGRKTYPKYYTL